MEYLAIIAILFSLVALAKASKANKLLIETKQDLKYIELQNKNLKEDLEKSALKLGKQINKASLGRRVSLTEAESGKLYDVIAAEEAKKIIDNHQDCLILDVREPTEFKSGHIPRAINISTGEIEKRWQEISSEASHVIVYCASGMRSANVCDFLSEEKGYINLHNLKNGIQDWTYTMEKPESKYTRFVPEMTAAEAMAMHPRAREVFASFHLGGCSSCAIAEDETVGQIMHNYGVEPEMLLGTLNSLLDGDEVKVDLPPESDIAKEKAQEEQNQV